MTCRLLKEKKSPYLRLNRPLSETTISTSSTLLPLSLRAWVKLRVKLKLKARVQVMPDILSFPPPSVSSFVDCPSVTFSSFYIASSPE